MITSLNVNQFLAKRNWKELQGKFDEKNKIWEKIKDFYYSYITKHLLQPEDVVVLHEVPYIKETKYSYCGEINFKRSDSISEIYTALEAFCHDNDFEILKPSTDNTFFTTVAIFKKGAYKKSSNDIIKKIFIQYAHRIIALERTVHNSKDIIIGLHIPIDGEDFWNYLRTVHKKLDKNKRIIYVGDLNTYEPNTINKNHFYKFLSEGLIDVWLENGNPHTKETFDGKTRIDYVLMTGKDFCNSKYEITIDDTIREQGYSDHSSIIMQIYK